MWIPIVVDGTITKTFLITLTNSNSSSSDTHRESAMEADYLEEDVDDDDDDDDDENENIEYAWYTKEFTKKAGTERNVYKTKVYPLLYEEVEEQRIHYIHAPQ